MLFIKGKVNVCTEVTIWRLPAQIAAIRPFLPSWSFSTSFTAGDYNTHTHITCHYWNHCHNTSSIYIIMQCLHFPIQAHFYLQQMLLRCSLFIRGMQHNFMQDAHDVRALLWYPLNCKTHIIKSKAVPQKGFELQANLQAEVRHHTDPVGQITFIYIKLFWLCLTIKDVSLL